MRLIEISYHPEDDIEIRNWINIDEIQSITDGDSERYGTIICFSDRTKFFDSRFPERFIYDCHMVRDL